MGSGVVSFEQAIKKLYPQVACLLFFTYRCRNAINPTDERRIYAFITSKFDGRTADPGEIGDWLRSAVKQWRTGNVSIRSWGDLYDAVDVLTPAERLECLPVALSIAGPSPGRAERWDWDVYARETFDPSFSIAELRARYEKMKHEERLQNDPLYGTRPVAEIEYHNRKPKTGLLDRFIRWSKTLK